VVNLLFLVIAISLLALFCWALLAPRRLWKAAIGWSYRDPYRNQPSAAVFGLYRLVAVFGILSVGATVIAVNQPRQQVARAASPAPAVPVGKVVKMWGAPAPQVLNRLIVPASAVPSGLVAQPVLGYQVMDGSRRQPDYLFGLPSFSRSGATDANGLVGVPPRAGLTALDTADLVVHVRGDQRCFPQQVVIEEDSRSIRIGVYYGRPNPADGSNAAVLADCNPKPAAAAAVSLLLPLRLSDAVGSRQLQSLDGAPLHRVRLLSN
jgi:hypothetical protein